jgi:allophanate hydrolase subunit 1
MMGFAAGFGYRVPEGPWLLDWSSVARRDRPRDRVPAGSVALAAGMSAVYPEEMPGGWQLLGHTSARLFDAANASSPSLLRPSDTVRFIGGHR